VISFEQTAQASIRHSFQRRGYAYPMPAPRSGAPSGDLSSVPSRLPPTL